MTPPGYLRYPHIHGDLLAFVAGDEVWLAPAAGGRAWPLTADGAQVGYPRFSPDGAKIAWTSSRDGGPEVYLAGTDGGDPARHCRPAPPARRRLSKPLAPLARREQAVGANG